MPAHISLITLGVADVAKATTFYERLGLTKSKESQESISFFQAGPVVLALWGRDAQRDDAEAAAVWTGNGGIVVAQNLPNAVDVMMAAITAISPTQTGMFGRSPSIPSGNWMKTAGSSLRISRHAPASLRLRHAAV